MRKKFLILLCIMFIFFLFNIKVNALEEGIYTIHSSLNKNYVLDITDCKASSGAKIQLYSFGNIDAQRFYIKKNPNGMYTIMSAINNNYVFDVYNGYFSNYSKIQLYATNNTAAQMWNIKENSDGTYTFYSLNNYVLEVKDGIINNHNTIQLFASNGTAAQKFYLERSFEKTKAIPNGLYTISSKLNENKNVEIKGGSIYNGNNIQLYSNNETDAQKWYIEYLNNGYYSIKSYLNPTYVFDVHGGKNVNNTNVQLFSSNGTKAQQWIIRDTGNGYYNIIAANSNLFLDVQNCSVVDGANIQLYTYNNSSNAQQFKIKNVIEKGKKTIATGYYFIQSKINIGKVIEPVNGNIILNNNVQIYDFNYSHAQKWYIKYLNNGYYAILCDKDNNYGLEYGINDNIQINKYTGAENQKWIIKKVNGVYCIIANNGKYIDLSNANISNGNNIGLHVPNGSTAQKWFLQTTASGISDNVIEDGIYRISSALDNSKVIDLHGGYKTNGTNIQLFQSNGTNAQKWKVEYLKNDYYKIISLVDLSKSFDVAGWGIVNGTNLQLYENNNLISQQWIIKAAGDGYFYIISNCNGLYLDVTNGSAHNGSNIQMYEGNGTNAQKFKFIKSEEKTRVIDVSYHQGTIDWNKVANSGIYGVILRIGYWNTEDEKFSEYINEVKRLDIPYGIYIFSYANTINGANTEANFTNSIINRYNLNPTLGIYYDLEDWYLSADNTSHTLSKNQYDDIARTYINNVSSYVGSKYKVKIYADLNHVNNRFGDYARGQSDWIAHYGASSCGYKGPHSLWQYTSEATLDGIRGFVDMNYLY